MKAKTLLSFSLLSCLLSPSITRAWQVDIHENPYIPKEFIGVSKKDKKLYLLEKEKNENSEETIKLIKSYPSIHGEVEGDKHIEGDLKTPEGVYFITRKIQYALDYEEYGSGAYELNYPNPIDKIKQKTGSGIWLHSKGLPIEGQVTEGCVAIDLDHFHEASEKFNSLTPVVLANKIDSFELEAVPVQSSPISNSIEETQSSTPNNVQNNVQKEDVSQTEQIQNLPATPTQEIFLGNPDLKTLEIKGTVYIEEPRYNTVENVQEQSQENNSNTFTSVKTEEEIYQEPYTNKKIYPPHTNLSHINSSHSSLDYQLVSLPVPQENEDDSIDNPILSVIKHVAENVAPTETETKLTARNLVEQTKEWNHTWANRDEAFFDFYDKTKYGLADNSNFSRFETQKRYFFKNLSWINILYGEIYALEGTDYWVTWFEQHYKAANNVVSEGVRRLYWQKNLFGEYKIVAMEWLPKKTGLYKDHVTIVHDEIKDKIKEWQMAWLHANVENYRTHYATDAKQERLQGEAIFLSKETLWSNKQPTAISFNDLEIIPEKDQVRVYMKQKYTDSSGYSDYGRKHLILVKENDVWKIKQETWSRI